MIDPHQAQLRQARIFPVAMYLMPQIRGCCLLRRERGHGNRLVVCTIPGTVSCFISGGRIVGTRRNRTAGGKRIVWDRSKRAYACFHRVDAHPVGATGGPNRRESISRAVDAGVDLRPYAVRHVLVQGGIARFRHHQHGTRIVTFLQLYPCTCHRLQNCIHKNPLDVYLPAVDDAPDTSAMKQMTPDTYASLLPLVQEPPVNLFMAQAVLRRWVGGVVYADDPGTPTCCFIHHAYGMAYLIGYTGSSSTWEAIVELLYARKRQGPVLLQVYPREWDAHFDALVRQGRVIQWGRTNFGYAGGA